MLVTYLSLLPTFIGVVLLRSFAVLLVFAVQLGVVLVGTVPMFGDYRKEMTKEEELLLRKLDILLTDSQKVLNNGYSYSLTGFAYSIASQPSVTKITQAWNLFINQNGRDLSERLGALTSKSKSESSFPDAFKEFDDLLQHLFLFRDSFYRMVAEVKSYYDFQTDIGRREVYRKVIEEHDSLMNRARLFSDDVKARTGLFLSENNLENLKNFG